MKLVMTAGTVSVLCEHHSGDRGSDQRFEGLLKTLLVG